MKAQLTLEIFYNNNYYGQALRRAQILSECCFSYALHLQYDGDQRQWYKDIYMMRKIHSGIVELGKELTVAE
jgi:hypothetical protein